MLARVRMLAPLRERDFRLLWLGMSVSLLGDGVFFVALAWQVYDLSNAPTALSMVGVAMTVPQVLFLLVGGVVSDRVDRRRVMLAADAVRAVAMVLLGTLSIAGTLALWHVAVLAAVYGAGAAFFGPAFDAVVPDLVPEEQLAEANALEQVVRPVTLRMAGPAIGGFLIAAGGPGWAFVLDGVTFAVSAFVLLLMRSRPRPLLVADGKALSPVREALDGFRYVRQHVWLWGTFVAATIAYLLFMGPTEVLLPYIVRNELGGNARDLGLVFSVGGIGALSAAVIIGQRGLPRRHVTFIYLTWTVATLSVAGYGLAVLPWQVMAASFVFNGLETAGTIVWSTLKHRMVPTALLGRVSSYDWFISIGLLPVSFALTGPAAALLGARTTLVVAGVAGGAITLAFLFLPGMRRIEDLRLRLTAWTLPAPPPELLRVGVHR